MTEYFEKITNDIESVEDAGLAISTNKTKQIPAFKCPTCLQHQSLYEYAIDNTGVVTPTFECQCGYKGDIAFTEWDSKKYKNKRTVYLALVV